MTTVSVHYAHSLDVFDWEGRYRAGQVPDRWPYGLDHLHEHVQRVHVRQAPSGYVALCARVARAAGGGYDWARCLDVHAEGRRSGTGEVILAWDERAGVPLALSSQQPVVSGVIWLTDAQRRRRWSEWAARRALQRCGAVWALSSAQLPELRENWQVNPRRLHHLPFGVDAAFWSASGPGEVGRVLVVGNDRDRDHATAVRAAGLAQRAVRSLRLRLVTHHQVDVPGDLGDQRQQLSHGDLRREYQRARVCAVAVKPNLHCSGITTVLEAMACGRPVVVTDTPGMRDYVSDGEHGLLVPPGDAEAMADAITALLRDPDRAQALGSAGRERVAKAFTTRAQAARLAELIHGAA